MFEDREARCAMQEREVEWAGGQAERAVRHMDNCRDKALCQEEIVI